MQGSAKWGGSVLDFVTQALVGPGVGPHSDPAARSSCCELPSPRRVAARPRPERDPKPYRERAPFPPSRALCSQATRASPRLSPAARPRAPDDGRRRAEDEHREQRGRAQQHLARARAQGGLAVPRARAVPRRPEDDPADAREAEPHGSEHRAPGGQRGRSALSLRETVPSRTTPPQPPPRAPDGPQQRRHHHRGGDAQIQRDVRRDELGEPRAARHVVAGAARARDDRRARARG